MLEDSVLDDMGILGEVIPDSSMDLIIGFKFNEKNKIEGYVYQSESEKLDSIQRLLFTDQELTDYLISEYKKYEISYVGEEYKISLTIKDKDLFQSVEALEIERETTREVKELQEKISQLESVLTNLTNAIQVLELK